MRGYKDAQQMNYLHVLRKILENLYQMNLKRIL